MMESVDETLDALEHFRGKARVVAGGTDLLIQFLEKESGSRLTLLDVSSIPTIRGVSEEGGWTVVGAVTTMAELAESRAIRDNGRALFMGASSMGAPQIRCVATIGGNVVNAQPAADTTIPLLALGAEAKVVSATDKKWVGLEELFIDVGRSVVDPTKEMITHFRFQPTGQKSTSSLQRLAKRKAFTLPTLLVAARVELDEDRKCFETVCIAAGPVARTPWRAKEAENSLSGVAVSREAIENAAAIARSDAQPRDSVRGGAEYRKDMVEILVKRALGDCLCQLGVLVHE